MRNKLIKIIPLFFIVLFYFDNANAAAPSIHKMSRPLWILPYKPYHKEPSLRNVKDGAYEELVEEQINVEEKAIYNHFITDIVSESGVQDNSEISVDFDPLFEKLDFHEITLWRNGKPQNRLDIKAFKILAEENELDKFIYDGTYAARYILADVRKGDRIEYSYTITGRNPIFYDKFCKSIYFQGSGLIMHQYTTLIFATARKLNMKSFNMLSSPKISKNSGFIKYEWEDFYVPGVPTNKFEPKWVNKYAHVQVSEFSSWAEVINWGLKINPIQTTFSGELADTISNLKKRFRNDKLKALRAATMFVQDDIRYMGIETGPYSQKANQPEKVFKQRYGDCKDKSLLLTSILNANGIEAHVVLLNTDLTNSVTDYIPSATLFDHAVVVATLNGKLIWIDPTISNQRGKGTELYFPQYGRGLILKAGNTGFTDIKPPKTGETKCFENYTIADELSTVKFSVKTIYTLNDADDVRSDIASTGITQLEKNYLDYYSKTYNNIEISDSIKIEDNVEKNEITILENYKIRNFFKRDSVNGKYTAGFYADIIANKLPNIGGQIQTPVSVSFPFNVDYTIKISLPYGWDMNDEHDAIDRNAYKFVSDKTVSGNDLTLHYRFNYLQDYVPLNKLFEFKQDIKNLKDERLYFSFFYIPDIKKVPFRINSLMVVISILIIGVSVFAGYKIYNKETTQSQYITKNSLPPPLGGWLIVLAIVLVTTPLGIIKILIDGIYFSVAKWELITTGIDSLMNKILLVFEVVGYLSAICFSVFCLVLVLKKRDISVSFLKGYYLFMVTFSFINYFFKSMVKHDFSSNDMEQIIKVVIVAALWTYYLNTSSRVKQTFTIPYPNML